MARGCMNPARARQTGQLLTLLLVAAFALAGWKVFKRLPAPDFLPGPNPNVTALRPMPKPSQEAKKAGAQILKQQLSPDGRFSYAAQFVSATPGQAVHAASLVELRDGRLRAVWFSGSKEGAGDVTIQSAVMDQASLQWSQERTLFDRQQVERGLWRYVRKLGNPVIARAADGSLLLWMVNVSLGGWAGSAISWSRSDDDGASWSEPRRLVTSPFLNISTLVKGAPVALAGGQLSLPVYHEFLTKFAEVLRINAKGEVVDKVRIPDSQTSLQPVMLVAGANDAQVLMRSSRIPRVMASTTADAGKTWSPARPAAWPNPDSALAGVVTDTGARWLALNPIPAGRSVLALFNAAAARDLAGAVPLLVEPPAVAQVVPNRHDYEMLLGDELRARGATEAQARAYTGSAVRQLCDGEKCAQEFSYPFLLQSSDGYIHLVYTWHRTRIKYVRIDPLQSSIASANGAG
jgi:predicted neuraminidase